METETHRHEKCETDLQQSPNFHILNIILGHSEVHAIKSFGSQPAMMLIICHKRHIFQLSVLFQATRQANN